MAITFHCDPSDHCNAKGSERSAGGDWVGAELLRSTKWRTHSNLVVKCDVVSWFFCAYKRELIKLFFIRCAGGQAGGLAMMAHF